MRTPQTAGGGPTPKSAPRAITGAVWTALALVYVVWGSTYLAIRIVVRTMPPFLSAGARFLAAGLLLLGLVALRYGPGALRATRRQAGSAVVLVVVASALWSLGSFSASKLSLPDNPFTGSGYQMLAGGAGGIVVALVRGEHRSLEWASFSTASWLALGYLVLFGSLVAFTAYVWLLRAAPLSLVATYAYVNPVVAVALGALILDEALTVPILVGGAIVVVAVCVIVSTERRR
ncbi:EamA family transporter [Streptomyces vinaceus]|uniref:EamA family transporter n=1 Tax=Streptomyces vinaceus TaxID=1960 RepID=UPI00367CCCC2